jgi:adenylylsulfate kinase-like enzyme
MPIALIVLQAAVSPVRKSRRHAQRWKNIPVDRIFIRIDMRRRCE